MDEAWLWVTSYCDDNIAGSLSVHRAGTAVLT